MAGDEELVRHLVGVRDFTMPVKWSDISDRSLEVQRRTYVNSTSGWSLSQLSRGQCDGEVKDDLLVNLSGATAAHFDWATHVESG